MTETIRGEYTRKRPCVVCGVKTTTRSPRYYQTGRLYYITVCLRCFAKGRTSESGGAK